MKLMIDGMKTENNILLFQLTGFVISFVTIHVGVALASMSAYIVAKTALTMISTQILRVQVV